jgi:sporulation protein YlmC with PRC-barrel domain
MDTLRTLGLAVALGLSSAALAQTQTPPDNQAGTQSSPPASTESTPATGSPDPNAASSPHQREATSSSTGSESAPAKSPEPSAASSPHQREALGASPGSTAAEAPKLVGLQVVSASGEQLGSVTDVMADSSGAPSYVVIAPVPSSGGGASTAIPYSTATSMVRNDTLVMDRAKLDGAPKVDQSKLKDPASTTWQGESDSYWGNTRAASKDEKKPTG